MSFLDLDGASQTNLQERARLNPLDLSQGDTGIFDGAVSAPFKGLVKGLVVEPGRALNLALSAIPRAIDTVRGGTDVQDWWFEKMVSERSGIGRAAEELMPDPHTTGIVGQVLHSFFDIGGQAVAFGPFATGVLKGTAKATELVEKGVDADTALKAGAVEGVTLGVGVHLPMSIGLRSFGNAFYGAAASVIPNMAGRGGVHTILAENGFHELAEQYQWLDRQQIAIDAILGVGLGFLGTRLDTRRLRETLRASDIDAALAAHNAKHAELDTAPGIPTTPAAREAHVSALSKAMDDLIEGRPVDISQTRVTEATFLPRARRAEVAEEVKPLLKSHDDAVAAVRAAANDFEAVPRATRTEPEGQPSTPAESPPPRREAPEAAAAPKAEGQPAEPGGKAEPEAPEVGQAMQAITERPDMEIRLVDGTTMKAAEAAKMMDEVLATAKNEASAFDAAVQCFLRG